jgi:hypothetical protein
MSVNLWITFSSVYGRDITTSEGKEHHEYNAHPIPPEILQPVLTSFIKPGLEFLTSLSITNQTMSRSQWVNLARLPNLCLLFIDFWGCPKSSEDDYLDGPVIRAWSNHALEAGGFPQLRVLILPDQHVTSQFVLYHLAQLPMLQLCSLGTTGEGSSYRVTWPSNVAPEEDEHSRWELWPEGSR